MKVYPSKERAIVKGWLKRSDGETYSLTKEEMKILGYEVY